MTDTDFDLLDFLPYLLNRAAEASSLAFQGQYKKRYGMLRTEWRVLFHLGRYGPMTAKEIGARAGIHKTKISRAVKALEARRFLTRRTQDEDRRLERLSLTGPGLAAYRDLCGIALTYDRALAAQFSAQEQAILRRCLRRMAGLTPP